MRWKTYTFAALVSALAAGLVWAQSGLVSNTLTGNEVVVCAIGGPGGPSLFCPVAQLRNATSFKTFASVAGNPTYQALNTDSTLYWVGAAPTTWTITTPVAPYDGEILQIGTDTTLTSMVTVTASTGQSLNSSYSNQTLTGKTSVEFMYSVATTKWYELR